MILNEDYFKNLEITDDDVIEDVEEPKHEMILKEAKKLHNQYNQEIKIRINIFDGDTTFIQTSLLPRIFKILDVMFESYGIEHS